MSIKSYVQAVKDVTAAEMRRDEKVFIMGEDIEVLGGIFGATRGLADEFGTERVRNTPISEAGFISAALGAACAGMRPIVELMYMDFSLVAADSIINQVAKTRYIFGGKAKVPLVIRGQQGVGRGNAATHSQSLETLFMHFPGLKVAMPSDAYDAAGLLRAAIRDDNPTIVIEHKALYKEKCDVPDDPDFMIPFGVGRVLREGTDVTVIATHTYVGKSLAAAEEMEKEGISVEVIDPRTLVPLDIALMSASVKKTGRCVVVHEAHRVCGAGAEIASQLYENCFPYLDAPIERLGAKQCPLPFNLGLENAVVPQPEDIVRAIRRTLHLKGE